jgi:hypothetical protein
VNERTNQRSAAGPIKTLTITIPRRILDRPFFVRSTSCTAFSPARPLVERLAFASLYLVQRGFDFFVGWAGARTTVKADVGAGVGAASVAGAVKADVGTGVGAGVDFGVGAGAGVSVPCPRASMTAQAAFSALMASKHL